MKNQELEERINELELQNETIMGILQLLQRQDIAMAIRLSDLAAQVENKQGVSI